MIETIGSPHLRATVDVGNYLLCGQAGHDGTAAAARHAAYVHLKDYRRGTGDSGSLEACTPGEGDVDHARCLRALQSAGYRGFVALEYEGSGDERQGVRDGVAFMKKAMGAPAQHGS